MTTRSEPGDGRLDPSLSAIMSERRQLINVAYRLLGSLADAEDVVQETYARWYAMSRQQQEAIDSPGGWLTTVASRICLDLLGSARARRERYVGEWIPEPLPDRTEWINGRSGGTTVDPADRVTLDESITMAFLVVLESMTPAERVAFVLHDVFRYPFAEVAEIVGRTPAACRQLASSARRRLRASRPPATPTAQRAGIVRDFKQAWEAKDIDALVGLLDPDATAIGDGGGLVSAALRPIEGGEQVARLLVDIAGRAPDLTILERTVNGQPGLVAQQDGVTVTVMAFDIAGDRIKHIWAVRNPEKLRPWTTGRRASPHHRVRCQLSMPGGNSDTEIRLIDVGDADAIAARRARDADAFARWEPSRPADFSSADGQRERIEQLLDDHRNGDRWPGVALADGAVTGQVTVSTILGGPFGMGSSATRSPRRTRDRATPFAPSA